MLCSSSSNSGMSLVEVLVALAILALASTAIVMTMPRRETRLDREVHRLEGIIERLSDEAIASGEVRGLRIEEDGYLVEVWRGGRWQALQEAYELPNPVELKLQHPAAQKPAKVWPDIIADETGFVTSMQLVIQDGTKKRVLVTDASGAVRVES
ncbi:prepilin-type N-terminal cleavage/methylation domain-containing protein [Hyphomonas pacifica]|uniref:prepilin-type N-terminal cleavage/methylation domain-containing protein n=1 Tax=Hyphomonas pacifica TaxID=1280941 RepID=UPI000DC03F97|nr:prepilin-type N-terminal cleavage/methylation domain-containing protein [Hyphomonas pacifica]RAN33115.1 hypothetical protein HY11_16960 [Hyphomonas pacifica]